MSKFRNIRKMAKIVRKILDANKVARYGQGADEERVGLLKINNESDGS